MSVNTSKSPGPKGPGRGMRGVALDRLSSQQQAAVNKTALDYKIADDDPIWPVFSALLKAGGDVEKSADKLLSELAKSMRDFDKRADEISTEMNARFEKATQIVMSHHLKSLQESVSDIEKSAGRVQAEIKSGVNDALKRSVKSLDSAADQKSSEMAQRWTDQALEAVEKRVRSKVKRRNAISFSAVAFVVLAAFIAGGVGSLTVAWALNRIAPTPIKACYRVKSGILVCELTGGKPYIRLPSN